MITGKKVVKTAKTWLNTPHVNGARVKGVGVDCGQFLIAVAEESGAVPVGTVNPPPYSNVWHLHRSEPFFERLTQAYCDPVKGDIQAGDYLLYQYGRCVSHGGIYDGNGHVIHAYIRQGVVLSNIDDVMFYDNAGRSRLRGVYRLKGVK